MPSHDRDSTIIAHVQQVRSHESEVLQVADLLIGAIAYHENAQDRRVVSWITERAASNAATFGWTNPIWSSWVSEDIATS